MLEIILQKYFNLKEDWNDDYETERDIWLKSYDKLIDLIYDLEDLGVIENANKIVDKLDKIDSLEM